MQVLPELTPENTPFWTGGASHQLLIAHCDRCDSAIHPPEVICPVCLNRSVTARPVAGTGTVYTFTVNHQPWWPGMAVPSVIVVVDLDGEEGVRITAELKGGDPESVSIGDRVQVAFTHVEDVWIPHFEKIASNN